MNAPAYELRILKLEQILPTEPAEWINFRIGVRKVGSRRFRYRTLGHNGQRFARGTEHEWISLHCPEVLEALARLGYPDSVEQAMAEQP